MAPHPTSTVKSGKYPNRIHYNDPTKIQLPTGCNVFHQEGVQQHPGKIYANGTLQNGNQQIDTNRSMIWTGTLCWHVRFRTMATPRFHQEQAPHWSSTKE
jgi:hypothetical protein